MVLAIAMTIFGVGVAIGADIQDRMAEGHRRRAAQRHRELSAIIRQLRDRRPDKVI
jgi:hypothetical protein